MPEYVHPYHTNGMKFIALDNEGNELNSWLVFSVGGGTIMEEGQQRQGGSRVYSFGTMAEIMSWCEKNKKNYGNLLLKMKGNQFGIS